MRLSEAWLLDDIRRRLFAPTTSASPRTIGIELELIPIWRDTRERALASSRSKPSTVSVLDELGSERGWSRRSNEDDPPSWFLAEGGCISFEPGGQIEISSAPHPTAHSVIATTRATAVAIRSAMAAAGIELMAKGADPFNPIGSVPLQLHRGRYKAMTRYFDSLGPTGVLMMRQTAALQLNLEHGDEPLARWRLLNKLVPFMIALFANSRRYENRATEWASYRSSFWRTLDPSRTGVIWDDPDPASAYFQYALDAGAIQSKDGDAGYRSFREWMKVATLGEEDWLFHLSTLFPEVRPREYFEVRSADTIDIDYLAAPIVFICGLVYDTRSAKAAEKLLPAPDIGHLERAGRKGLADPDLRQLTSAAIELALEGARRCGEDYLASADLSEAAEYFEQRLTAH